MTLVKTLAVSSAQLLALDGTPLTIVPAPGQLTYNLPQSVSVFYQAGSTPYTLTGANTHLTVGFMPNPAATYAVRVIIDTVNTLNDQIESNSVVNMQQLASDGLNMPLGIQLDQAVTLGDGTLFVTVHYVLV